MPDLCSAILEEAYSLSDDLSKKDAEAATLVGDFRELAKAALLTGQEMPLPPIRLRTLQEERERIVKSHISILRAKLGVEAATKLDDYLRQEIGPHVSLRSIAVEHSPVPPTSGNR